MGSTSSKPSSTCKETCGTCKPCSKKDSNINASEEDGAITQFRRGDLIKTPLALSKCCSYNHIAVYMGGGEIIHLTKPGGKDCCKCKDDVVFVEGNTERVCTTCHKKHYAVIVRENSDTTGYKLANIFDDKESPLPTEQIIERATSLLGPVKYDVKTFNCEHFANWCRYNIPFCMQSKFGRKITESYLKKVKGEGILGCKLWRKYTLSGNRHASYEVTRTAEYDVELNHITEMQQSGDKAQDFVTMEELGP